MVNNASKWPDTFSDALAWHCLRAEKLAGLLGLPHDLAFGVASRLVSLSEMPTQAQRVIMPRLIEALDELLESLPEPGVSERLEAILSMQ
jgi:hypothetical protein